MDADPSIHLAFWPKVGERCRLVKEPKKGIFTIVNILKDWPVDKYQIRSLTDGSMQDVFRHQIQRTSPAEERVRETDKQSTFDDSSSTIIDLNEIPEDMLLSLFDDYWGREEPVKDPETVAFKMEEPSHIDSVSTLELSAAQLDELDESVKPEATNRATKWALKKFKEWQQKKGIQVDLATIHEEELGSLLRQFYAEVRQVDQKMFSPGTLRSIRAGINRAITSPPLSRAFNIIDGNHFKRANITLETMCKKWVGTGRTSHHPAIEEGDLKKLESYFSKYETDPEILIHTFWFLLCYFFARRGREGFRELTKSSLCIKKDDCGIEYLTENNPQASKNWKGGSSSKAWDYSDVRAYSITLGSSSLNIVQVYKFLLMKLYPSNEALFQKPLKNWRNSGQWFGETVLGKNKLGSIMSSISKATSLSQIYTNHSVRATAITVMYQGGVDVQHICKLTKHKREESLKHYISGQTSAQKRACSGVLGSAISCSKDEQKITPTSPKKKCTQAPGSNYARNTLINETFSFPSMANNTFNITGGNCHFHFYSGQ